MVFVYDALECIIYTYRLGLYNRRSDAEAGRKMGGTRIGKNKQTKGACVISTHAYI